MNSVSVKPGVTELTRQRGKAAAWQHIPSTYLVCADDRSTSPALQREHAARATRTVELDTGHHPFLSRPDLVAASLREIASAI